MNPGAIKIIWFERARQIGAVQRICTAPRSIPVEQEQDSVLRKGEMSILKNIFAMLCMEGLEGEECDDGCADRRAGAARTCKKA